MEGRRAVRRPAAARRSEAVESDDDVTGTTSDAEPGASVGYDISLTVTHIFSVTRGRPGDENSDRPAGPRVDRDGGRAMGPAPASSILEMDYKGQELAEKIFMGIIQTSAIIGFMYGYWVEDFGWTISIFLSGFVISCVMTLPPWPMYRQHPLKWLSVQDSRSRSQR
ncbi:signal peptidase complex subunit 1-like [Tachyglossus aculeatus]|uniref:signal peptidase complex subunit 1-like n=1 Tax=Tachyglossus aculeatus TaxID=9261 RepID=UPI0018F71566|nr:signal peptidase complex subunit 1-like [Tachyglossus aculeatus]